MMSFNNFWNWREYDPQFTIFFIHYWPGGFYRPDTKNLSIILLNFGIMFEWGGGK